MSDHTNYILHMRIDGETVSNHLLKMCPTCCWFIHHARHPIKEQNQISLMCVLQRDRVQSLSSSKYLKALASAPRSPLDLCPGLVSPLVSGRTSAATIPLFKGHCEQGIRCFNISYSERIFFIWRGTQADASLNSCCVSAAPVLGEETPQQRIVAQPPLVDGEDCWWSEPCLLRQLLCVPGPPWAETWTFRQPKASAVHPDLHKAIIFHQIPLWNRSELKAPAFQVLPPSFIKIVAIHPVGLFLPLASYGAGFFLFFLANRTACKNADPFVYCVILVI